MRKDQRDALAPGQVVEGDGSTVDAREHEGSRHHDANVSYSAAARVSATRGETDG